MRQMATDFDHGGDSYAPAVALFQSGLVDTEGLRAHVAVAHACGLPIARRSTAVWKTAMRKCPKVSPHPLPPLCSECRLPIFTEVGCNSLIGCVSDRVKLQGNVNVGCPTSDPHGISQKWQTFASSFFQNTCIEPPDDCRGSETINRLSGPTQVQMDRRCATVP